MKENLIEVAQYDGPGYRALVYYEGWRVAFLNDDSEQVPPRNDPLSGAA